MFILEVGIAKSTAPEKRSQQLAELSAITSTLPFTAEMAQIAARIRATLETTGTPIGPYDILIGATAVATRATLVTRNTEEYGRIENLVVENWY